MVGFLCLLAVNLGTVVKVTLGECAVCALCGERGKEGHPKTPFAAEAFVKARPLKISI
jgi:hypothetical protein